MLGAAQPTENSKTKTYIKTVYHNANIEGRISFYDRNYAHRLVFFITTFFAGKWDLQGRVPIKSLEHPYML